MEDDAGDVEVEVTKMADEADDSISSCFAPAGRASAGEVEAQHQMLLADANVAVLLESLPEPAMILNRQRQIVLANDRLSALLGRPTHDLLGLRPGEAFSCVHAADEPGGCGTTTACRFCGTTNAIVASQRDHARHVQECRLVCERDEHQSALDLQVWATPLPIRADEFTVYAIHDTSDEKRRLVLERLFFHDVLNSVASLRNVVDLLPELDGDEAAEMSDVARRVTDDVVEQIRAQRDLAAAERGDLVVQSTCIDVRQLLDELRSTYSRHPVAIGRSMPPPRTAGQCNIVCDPVLLRRVLANLLKNALEASGPGEAVTIDFDNQVAPTFRIHNVGPMSEEVQAQVFQRSFSTKDGSGRGLGTYSVRLLTETYLHGSVWFTSTPQAGTTFTVALPASPDVSGALAED